MKKVSLVVLALLGLAAAITVPNEFDGEGNEVLSGEGNYAQGRDNTFDGDFNDVWGNSNFIRGNENDVEGDSNDIQGD